jgi:hypothetical protein
LQIWSDHCTGSGIFRRARSVGLHFLLKPNLMWLSTVDVTIVEFFAIRDTTEIISHKTPARPVNLSGRDSGEAGSYNRSGAPYESETQYKGSLELL